MVSRDPARVARSSHRRQCRLHHRRGRPLPALPPPTCAGTLLAVMATPTMLPPATRTSPPAGRSCQKSACCRRPAKNEGGDGDTVWVRAHGQRGVPRLAQRIPHRRLLRRPVKQG